MPSFSCSFQGKFSVTGFGKKCMTFLELCCQTVGSILSLHFFWWYLSLFLCRFLFLLRFIAFYFAVFPLMSIAKLGWALSSGLSDTLTQILNLLANKQSSIQLKTTFMSPTTIIWTHDKMKNVISKLWFGYFFGCRRPWSSNGPKQARKLLWPTHS